MRRGWLCSIIAGAVGMAWAAAGAPGFADPMESAAAVTSRAAATPMTAVTRAGARFVAVGVRGTVLLSDDAGRHWQQAAVPVSSDLVAVHFVSADQGWTSGHDGVILHTADGGRSWQKQLDGRRLEALLRAAYRDRAAAGDAVARHLQDEIERDYERGTQQPLLGIWFADERNGFAVGSFGIVIATRDGGATWEPWIERIDNPEMLHLFAIGDAAGQVLVTSEKGTVFRLDAARQRFVAANTGYPGSLFGFVADADCVIAFGLRGNAVRSLDRGASWQKLATGVATGLNGGTLAAGRTLLIASQGGQLLASNDHGQTFHALPGPSASAFAGVAAADGYAVLAGLNGVQAVALP